MSDNHNRPALPPSAFVSDLKRRYPVYSLAAFDRAVLVRLTLSARRRRSAPMTTRRPPWFAPRMAVCAPSSRLSMS